MWRPAGDHREKGRLPERRFTYRVAQHSWGDSNLYVRRSGKALRLAIEHRAAPEPEPLSLALLGDPDAHLEVRGRFSDDDDADVEESKRSDVEEAVLALLQRGPQTSRALRAAVGVRHAAVQETVAKLEATGLVRREGGQWVVAKQS